MSSARNRKNTSQQLASLATKANFVAVSSETRGFLGGYFNSGRDTLTLFFRKEESPDASALADSAIQVIGPHCTPNFVIGYRDDEGHDDWHAGVDFEFDHMHLRKSTLGDKWAEADLECLLDNLIEVGESEDFQHRLQGQAIITKEDKQRFLQEFKALQPEQQKEFLANNNTDSLTYKINEYFQAGAKSFIQSFLSTLIYQYLKPAYISRFNDRKAAEALAMSAGMAVNAISFPSLFDAALQTILANSLRQIINKFGFAHSNEIVQTISSALLILQNPLSLAKMGVQATAAAAGQHAALALIHQLPKLKIEQAETDKVIGTQAQQTPETIRKRF